MRKLREDSKWNVLTADQRYRLENWLFRENLGYARTAALAREEFGVEASLASVARYYHRRVRERQETTQEAMRSLMAAEMAAVAREEMGP